MSKTIASVFVRNYIASICQYIFKYCFYPECLCHKLRDWAHWLSQVVSSFLSVWIHKYCNCSNHKYFEYLNKNYVWRCVIRITSGVAKESEQLCWTKMRSQTVLTVNTKLGTDHGHLLFANSARSLPLPYFSSHCTHCFYAYCILPTSYYLRIAYILSTNVLHIACTWKLVRGTRQLPPNKLCLTWR